MKSSPNQIFRIKLPAFGSSSIVGKRVVEALNNGELYIFTHPNYRSEIQKRFKAIDDAFKDSEKSIALKESPDK